MLITLVGMPASGKSTQGLHLSKLLNLPFYDLDILIESAEKQSVKELFANKGEDFFREAEHKALVRFFEIHTEGILAAGGGTPCFFDNMDIILKHSTCYYLETPIHVLAERINTENNKRPLLQSADTDALVLKLEQLYANRAQKYKRAHVTVPFPKNISEYFA